MSTILYAIYSKQILGAIAHNVPAVGDVFAARIRALRSKDQGCKNVGGVSRGNGAKRNDLGERNPGAAEWRRNAYSPVRRSTILLLFFINFLSPIFLYLYIVIYKN
jgi:hypothetical protein